jgi:hypothetical protein
MILANTRGRLNSEDLRLVVLLLSQGSGARQARLEAQLAAEGPDALLDQPALLDRLLAVRGLMQPSATLFYYVVVRHLLRRATVDDRELADYLAAMLLEFGQRDRAFRIDWNDDHHHRYLIDIVADLEATDGERRFRVMAHLGNFALWLSGLFPDYIAARRLRKGGPDVSYYQTLGRRGFALASDHVLADQYHLDGIFRSAAGRFGHIRQALNELSGRLLFPAGLTH